MATEHTETTAADIEAAPYLHIEASRDDVAALAYDAAYLTRLRMADGPLDAEGLAATMASALMVAAKARDPDADGHDVCRAAVIAAREAHRRVFAPTADA